MHKAGDSDNAETARRGLVDSAVGKAKEAVGALLGNDALTREGQLRQAEGQALREAGADEAIAEARGTEAADQLAERHAEAREERQAHAHQAGAEQAAAERDRHRRRAEADNRAELERDVGEAVVRQRTRREVGEALTETREELAEANRAEAEADERNRRAQQEAAVTEAAAAGARAKAHQLGEGHTEDREGRIR
jgi:uncharacterized protein YjbJ (UPF0337 family)